MDWNLWLWNLNEILFGDGVNLFVYVLDLSEFIYLLRLVMSEDGFGDV